MSNPVMGNSLTEVVINCASIKWMSNNFKSAMLKYQIKGYGESYQR